MTSTQRDDLGRPIARLPMCPHSTAASILAVEPRGRLHKFIFAGTPSDHRSAANLLRFMARRIRGA